MFIINKKEPQKNKNDNSYYQTRILFSFKIHFAFRFQRLPLRYKKKVNDVCT